MRKEEVITAFLNKKVASNSTGNLSSTGSCLFSYSTCIAEWCKDGEIIINTTKYSTTTSQHQNLLRRRVSISRTVSDIPRNKVHLLKPEERYEV